MSPSPIPVTEGEVAFNPCVTWYKVVGSLGSRRPLIAIHGGPSVYHGYLLILADLTEKHNIPLVLYDQLGTGNSTHLPEKTGDVNFWTEQLFLDELDNLLAHLGVQDDYDILGHSWGGMLGARHAVHQPEGLKNLILFSTTAEMRLWEKAQNLLRTQLPQDVQDTLTKHEEQGSTDSEEYNMAMGVYYGRFTCTIHPLPQAIAECFAWIEKDPTVLLTMNGLSEFCVTGPLKDWSIIAEAHKINVPTLLLNGHYDMAQDSVMTPYFARIPQVKWFTFSESSHMAHFEEREKFMEIVGNFLVQ
ncbi:proline-specific peptidase [Mycena pura]|uniref:Proline-specific peptidase n=1 Tax=Mycena pura TaxID=153505 RepID=A0AAD6UPF6_9AGAR|nr:proline-specific peptidase [Mycena pura]